LDTGKRDFSKEAAVWDDNPVRVKLSNDIAGAIKQQIHLTPEMDIMDYGCGTGVLSLQLRPFVRSLTGVDSGQGMLDIFRAKAAGMKLDNVKTLLVDTDKGVVLTGSYDLVICSMTLHHVKVIEPLFHQFSKVTRPGGYLCIADLDPDDGLFHENSAGVFHHGFEKTALSKVFQHGGYINIRDVTAAEVVKPGNNGITRRFTMFLMVGQKKKDQPG
jgi:2-polyprenyl-3-methyl-5-hydroxy-6-metoxy-1,4-benzoquinol methylase